MNTLFRLVSRITIAHSHSWLAKFWHSCAPPCTIYRRWGKYKVFLNLRDNIDDITRPDLFHREPPIFDLCAMDRGPIWDVGCNVGQFAIPTAARGPDVIAFDISMRACQLLSRSAASNRLPVTVVPLAVTPFPTVYQPALSSLPTKKLRATSSTLHFVSLSFLTAAKLFGVPPLVKMDIEGGEQAFFESAKWRTWLVEHSIHWLVELHPGLINPTVIWRDFPSVWVDEYHGIYHCNAEVIEDIRRRLPHDKGSSTR